MKTKRQKSPAPATSLPKCRRGIQGLDEITGGGLPRGRPTLVCGGAGCGKTLLAAEFLVRGAVQYDEPGVLMAFEETEKELTANVASMGFDLAGLVRRKKIVVSRKAEAHMANRVAIGFEPLAELGNLRGAPGAVRPLDGEKFAGETGIAQFRERAAEESLILYRHWRGRAVLYFCLL